MKNIITVARRKKMAEASHSSGRLAPVKWIALGSGGVDMDNNVIIPLAENIILNQEEFRKEYTHSEKVSDTCYAYTLELNKQDLLGISISEIALIDAEGDVIAFSNFLPIIKDDVETSFTIEDSY